MTLQRGALFVTFTTDVALVWLVGRRVGRLATLVSQQLPRLTKLLLTGGTLEQVVHAVDVLVVKEMGGLHEALVAEVAFEWPVGGVFMRTPVPHQCVLLSEAHLTLVAVKGTLLRVCALMLAEVRRPLETLPAGGAAKWAGALWVAGVVQELGRLFEVQLAQITLKKVLARVHIHVAHKVGAVLKTFFTHSTLEGTLVAVRSLVVLEV